MRYLKHNLDSDFRNLLKKMGEARQIMSNSLGEQFKPGVNDMLFTMLSIGDEEISINAVRDILHNCTRILEKMEAIDKNESRVLNSIDARIHDKYESGEDDKTYE